MDTALSHALANIGPRRRRFSQSGFELLDSIGPEATTEYSNCEHDGGLPDPDLSSRSVEDNFTGLGVPKARSTADTLHILALGLLWICFAVTCSIIRSTPIAYGLGYNNQLIAVGLLLAVQLLCFTRTAPIVFSRIEQQYGKSRLQSFNAILLGTCTVTGSGLEWRLLFLFLTLLPLGLSAAYKNYPGGFVTTTIISNGHHYGLFGPGNLSILANHSGPSLMVNATIPFMAATKDLTNFLADSELPKAFGFNTLVLSNAATAILDAPDPLVVSNLQRALDVDETFTISAQVFATVSRYNNLLDAHRDENDSYWQELENSEQGGQYLYGNHCFNHRLVGYRSEFGEYVNNSWVMLATIPSYSERDYANPLPPSSKSPADFAQTASLFYTKREICSGTWTIRRTSIQLISGSCSGLELGDEDQHIICNRSLHLQSWYMSLSAEYLCPFSKTPRNDTTSGWFLPTMATFTATMIWSKLVGTASGTNYNPNFANQSHYFIPNDTLHHTIPVMLTSPSLFVILGILPASATVLFLIGIILKDSPIGKGFGLISILAGVDAVGLKKLRGAEYSGVLSEPVHLILTTESKNGAVEISSGDFAPRGTNVAYRIA